MKQKLTAKQKKFCHEHMIDLNATQAAIRAGYSPNTAKVIGSENLSKPAIVEYLGVLSGEVLANTDLTRDRVLDELSAIAFTNLEDLIDFDKADATLIEKDQRRLNTRSAVKKIKITRKFESNGESTETLEIELHDKLKALDMLGKYFGMFITKIEAEVVDGTQKAKYKALFDSMSPDEKVQWLKDNAR
tara:strand:- start:769 stop:1335 length:567 start_codon:yes stop_codon:yes gene_type:complete